MAFTITFYKISDPPNKLDKSLPTATKTASCTPFEPVADLTGSVLIDYVAGVEGCNYAQITQGTNQTEGRPRYCFITDIQKDVGQRMRVFLREDPLMTFKDQIKNWRITVDRCEKRAILDGDTGWNAYITDNAVKLDQRYMVQTKPLYKFTWDSGFYTLVTVG